MPELPEVETIRQELIPHVVGRTIRTVDIRYPPLVAGETPARFASRLIGRRVVDVRRRGKYLIFDLDDGGHWVVHLRMTGQFRWGEGETEGDKHTHARISFVEGGELHYRDVRKFGRFYWVRDEEELLGHLGPEPLSEAWTAEALAQAIGHRRAPVKALLLDQRVVAGLGNIYADEVLFVAGIHPQRPGYTLSDEEIRRVHEAVRAVLEEALAARGSTFRSYRRPGAQQGGYQHQHRVFRRTGEPCPVCGAPIQRVRIAGRSTHYCPRCQGAGIWDSVEKSGTAS
ncbi:MAG: bifunctional DNA-formamidopyrimidine glycosylase/DNA-(apurinic or apyrimidinic site) lyase [Chloroflexi bacterium]|nr:bifunctional DNA-formamidopyrimidine glycosylase/DNA-(apurinic or apyrimidinic site) lyase [Chloroflexota bacterium]